MIDYIAFGANIVAILMMFDYMTDKNTPNTMRAVSALIYIVFVYCLMRQRQ